jgi:general stress protein 26
MSLKEDILKVVDGEVVAAVATVHEGKPAVRYMALVGRTDLSLIGATSKWSRKISQIRKNPDVALVIWSGASFSDPYVIIHARAEIYEDPEIKKTLWYPTMQPFFQKPENPEYVAIKFIPKRIEYYHDRTMDLWES